MTMLHSGIGVVNQSEYKHSTFPIPFNIAYPVQRSTYRKKNTFKQSDLAWLCII